MASFPLPPLDGEYDLGEHTVDEYRHEGYAIVRGLASRPEASAYRRASGPEAARRFALARRFAKVAADLMGVKAVRLLFDRARLGAFDEGSTSWRQDGVSWPVDPLQTVVLWMPLVDVAEEMGQATFAAGSHQDGFVPVESPSAEYREAFLDGFVKGKGHPLVATGAMAAGDATFHSGAILYRPAGRVREAATVVYLADGLKVREPENEAQRNALAAYFPGFEPGDFAAGELNPLVYRRA